MNSDLYRHLRMFGVMIVITLVFALANASIRAQFEPSVAPATITTTTDGAVSRVEVYGGDVGYPGPSMVELRRDELGLLVVTTTRILPDFDVAVFLPMVQQ